MEFDLADPPQVEPLQCGASTEEVLDELVGGLSQDPIGCIQLGHM